MKPDMIVGWEQHLKNGNVWKVNLELSMQDVGDEKNFYSVDVYVVASNSHLAQYIVTTMYPDYESLSVDEQPVRTAP